MIKASAWRRALQHLSYRQIHVLIALYDLDVEWATYNDISASTGIAVSTLHGSAVVVLDDKGAVLKKKGELPSSQVKVKLTQLGRDFVESLYMEVEKV